ncbi:MAG: hypothetical protein Q4A16_00840 [Lautropia sp.]|nr:hypothetical protein [Lautropia sp.]
MLPFSEPAAISVGEFEATPLSPSAQHYTSYLVATAWGSPWPVVLVALLPCFWIHAEVGRVIHKESTRDNPYRAWIDTYAGEAFHEAVRGVLKTVDRVAAATDPQTRERMHRAYTQTARLEWMFWDAAWRLEKWPL